MHAPSFLNLNENEFEPSPNFDDLPHPSVFLRFLRRRRSLRVYKSKPVEIEKLKMIKEAGRFAPTGGNRQECGYIVVMEKEILDRVRSLAIQTMQKQAKMLKKTVDHCHLLKEPLSEKYITFQQVPSSFINRMAKKAEGRRRPASISCSCSDSNPLETWDYFISTS
jgi:nitroreductase